MTTRQTIIALTCLGLVVCTPEIQSVRGPDGQQWMMCQSGPDRLCIAAMGRKCPHGYTLSDMDRMFTCKSAEGTCATDAELASAVNPPESPGQEVPPRPGQEVAPPSVDAVRGPDCRTWVMCTSRWASGDYNRSRCLKSIGDVCPSGYDHWQVLGEDMYQCKAQPKADGGDAGAPEGSEVQAAGHD